MTAGPVPTHDADPLAAALTYAARGLRVLPIVPGKKHPPISAWQTAATTDPGTIEAWWTGPYSGHGVGIATGAGSGIWVLDIDDYDAYRDLERAHEPLPDTLTSITGSGGLHLVWRYPTDGRVIRNNAGTRLGAGLDVRGEGGQIVAPPTGHPSGGAYEWDAGQPTEPVDAPEWLLELVCDPPPTPARITLPEPRLADHARPGDHYAASVDWGDILTADGWALHHVDRNGERHWTRPGKERRDGTSATTGYTAADTLKVFTSSMQHAGLDPEGTYTKLGYIAATRHHGDHTAAADDLRRQGYGHSAPPAVADPATLDVVQADAHNPLSKYLIDWATFWTTDHNATEWLCEPLFAAGRAHALYAGAKTGKSFLVLAATAAMATGRPFLHKPASEPLDVLYVDYEMTPDDLHDRLLEFGYGPDDDLSHLHYALLPSLPPLDTDPGGLALIMAAEACGARFVVIDTTGRSTQGDENEASTFQDFYRHTGMRLKQAGIGWVRLDHAGKDAERGQRGSSAKNDDVDIVVRLTRNDAGVTVKATHRRIGWYPENTNIDIGEDGHGTTTFTATRGENHRPYAAGTVELVKHLDHLEVPVDLGRRAVRPILKRAGITATNTVLSDAIRFRRATRIDDLQVVSPPVDNPSDHPSDRSVIHSPRTTPRTKTKNPGIAGSDRSTDRSDHPSDGRPDHPVLIYKDRVGPVHVDHPPTIDISTF